MPDDYIKDKKRVVQLISDDDVLFIGESVNNVKDGRGACLINGCLRIGYWKNDQLNGKVFSIFDNGDHF